MSKSVKKSCLEVVCWGLQGKAIAARQVNKQATKSRTIDDFRRSARSGPAACSSDDPLGLQLPLLQLDCMLLLVVSLRLIGHAYWY